MINEDPIIHPAVGPPVQISSTIATFRLPDLKPNGKERLSSCDRMVDAAISHGSDRVNFMPTFFWGDIERDDTPDYYCLKLHNVEYCDKFDAKKVVEFKQAYAPCVKRAVKAGMHIYLTPHLDADRTAMGKWRNALLLNPLKKYNGMSYYDVMLRPLAEVVLEVMTPTTQVWFTMQGEMGATILHFPAQWHAAVRHLRQLFAERDPALAVNNLFVGISFNFNKVCGNSNCNENLALQLNLRKVQQLVHSVDFIGISAYPRYLTSLADMEGPIRTFSHEIASLGVNLTALNQQGTGLLLSEYGIGGGTSVDGRHPALTYLEAAKSPWFGIYGKYNRTLDPWRPRGADEGGVEGDQGARAYMRSWWGSSCSWLALGGGPNYRVDAAFVWNLASWDVQGLHPSSTNKEGSYRDDVVVDKLRDHNTAVRKILATMPKEMGVTVAVEGVVPGRPHRRGGQPQMHRRRRRHAHEPRATGDAADNW